MNIVCCCRPVALANGAHLLHKQHALHVRRKFVFLRNVCGVSQNTHSHRAVSSRITLTVLHMWTSDTLSSKLTDVFEGRSVFLLFTLIELRSGRTAFSSIRVLCILRLATQRSEVAGVF